MDIGIRRIKICTEELTGYRPHHLSHTVIVHIKGKDVDIARISVYLVPKALHLFCLKNTVVLRMPTKIFLHS